MICFSKAIAMVTNFKLNHLTSLLFHFQVPNVIQIIGIQLLNEKEPITCFIFFNDTVKQHSVLGILHQHYEHHDRRLVLLCANSYKIIYDNYV